MLVVTVAILVVMSATFILDFMLINSSSLRSKLESNQLVSKISTDALNLSKQGNKPNLRYIGRRYMGIIAIGLCVLFILLNVQIYN